MVGHTLFFELIQVSISTREKLSISPSNKEWRQLYNMACKQSIVGVLFDGFRKSLEFEGKQAPSIFFQWFGMLQSIEGQNKLQDQRIKELFEVFNEGGFRCCILKGQGTALNYEHPECRQCGDIDIWVEGKREDVVEFVRRKGVNIWDTDIKHADVGLFEDVPVEVHFMPSWMFSPIKNMYLQRFFAEKSDKQFRSFDQRAGFTHTTVDFDMVFLLVHIYRHVFFEGIGLRQLLDYYYILLHSDTMQRAAAYKVLKELGMGAFAGGIMWVMRECFAMKEEFSLCDENERHGRFLLSEIMIAGNFGHYDTRFRHLSKDNRFSNGFIQLKRNLRFLFFYPSEVIWSPFWKIWHYCWRKREGYL